MNRKRFILVILLCSFSLLFAQKKNSTVRIGTPWQGSDGTDVSVARMQEWEKAHPQTEPFSIHLKREFEAEREPKDNLAAPSVAQWPPLSKKQAESIKQVTSPQTIGVNFYGADIGESGYVPPDIVGDVGPTQEVMEVNGRIKVFNRTGGLSGFSISDASFWTTVDNGDGVSDPHVRYDPTSGRWFLVIITTPSTGANRVLIAVSNNSILTGASHFTLFQFQIDQPFPSGDIGNFADYPTLGVDANALYIGVNIFNPAKNHYLGSTAFVVRKSALLSGNLIVTAFREVTDGSTIPGPYTPQGVQNDDPNATIGYFIGVDALQFSTLDIERIDGAGATPFMTQFSITVPTTVNPIPQVVQGSASNRRLDAIDDRLFAAQIKKNTLTGVTSLWTAHNIQVGSDGVANNAGGRNGSRWYEITDLESTPTLRQAGTVFDPNSSNPRGYWIPSVAMSGQGHMALGASYASVNDFAGVLVSGRLSGDALGTTQAPTLAYVSSSPYNVQNNDKQRWGDFTQTVVDPNDNMTLWTFQEYVDKINSWALRVFQLLAPPPVTPSSASPSSLTGVAGSVDIIVTGTSSGGSGFYDPGAPYPNRISANISGSGVTVDSITFTSPTSITLHCTVANNTPPGLRSVTVTNPDGQSATSLAGILSVNSATCPTITLSPPVVPSGDPNVFYSQMLTASGGVAPYNYTIINGNLPSGITLSSAGLISGTTTTPGNFHFTVTAQDSNNCPSSISYTLSISGCPAITITPPSIPDTITGSLFNQTKTASGGTPPYTFAVTGGSLPTGLSLSSSGAVTGRFSAAGTFSFTMTAADSFGCTGSVTDTVHVTCPVITVTPPSLANDTVGNSFSDTLQASGGSAPYTFAVTSGSLPVGLSFSNAGVLSGIYEQAGTYSFTVTATDTFGCTASNPYTIMVALVPESVSVSVLNRWNMVSNPMLVANDSATVLFPGASSAAFAFGAGGYQNSARIIMGSGYWMKFPSAANYLIHGNPVLRDTLNVVAGWNIVGSISQPFPTYYVTSIPPGIQTGIFFQYNDGYSEADTIVPGKGYWVKVSQDGKLVFAPTSSFIAAANRIKIVPNQDQPPSPPVEQGGSGQIPLTYALEQNYPNPFNPSTNFRFQIADAGMVTLKVYDVLGQEVATVVNRSMNAGAYTVQWNANHLPSGIYYYRMTVFTSSNSRQAFSDVKKLLLMK